MQFLLKLGVLRCGKKSKIGSPIIWSAGIPLRRAQAALSEHLFYPPEAIARGLEGDVILLLTLSDSGQIVSAARKSTVVFSFFLVVIGSVTAYAAIVLKSGIIPIVLGIFGYTYGSLLGVFLVGMLTKTRGSERGNLIAMLCGFVAVAFLSGLHNDLWNLLHPMNPAFIQWRELHPGGPVFQHWRLDWLPAIEFPWRITAGTLVTTLVALCFRTPPERVRAVLDRLARPRA